MKLKRTLAAAVLLLALAGCSSDEDPLQPPAVPPAAYSWEPVHAGLTLTGIWGSSGTNVYAAGKGGTLPRYGP
jgi:hypothetical protein